jgi:hypothetical protein
MKKLLMVGLLLTAAIALQAQMKVAPKMEKGAVKTYVGQSTVTMPMQGDVKVNYETKYTIVDATADGYVVDLVTDNVQTECDANNIAGKLVAAAQEATKGIVFRIGLDKEGKIQKVLNSDEVQPKLTKGLESIVDQLMKDIPQLSAAVSKDNLMKQVVETFTPESLLKSFQESTSPFTLNGKTITTGAQEEYVSKDGMKMKRMYFVQGKNIVANSTLNMTKDEMKEMLIQMVEKSAPDQAAMVKENIDQIMSSGMLKMDMKETVTYELQDDGWVKSIKGESTTETMGQKVVTVSTITLK